LVLGSLDGGETLKQLIDVQSECMGENFLPSLFVLCTETRALIWGGM
jgi:hypothetical protein